MYNRKLNKQKLIIIGLSIALGLTSFYVVMDILIVFQQLQIIESYQQGFDDGAVEVVSRLFDQTQFCQISKIEINNKSKSLVDISCLENQFDVNNIP